MKPFMIATKAERTQRSTKEGRVSSIPIATQFESLGHAVWATLFESLGYAV